MATLASPALAQTPAAIAASTSRCSTSRACRHWRARHRNAACRQSQPHRFELERAIHRWQARRRASTRVRVSASGFQVQDVSVDVTTETSQTVEVRLRPAGYTEQLIVTADALGTAHCRRAGQRQRRHQRADRAVAGRRRRRRAAAGADVQPVPPHQQPCRESDGAGRVAARHRPERRQPHARAARRRSVQRSVRRLGLLDARADDERRAHRNHRRRHVEPLRQLRDGRRHQHRDQPCRRRARSSSSRSTATARRRRWICLPATCGASSASRSMRRRCRPTATRSWPKKSADRSTTKRTSSIRTSARKLDYNPTDRVNLFFRGGHVRRGAQQRQDRRAQRHELEVRQRRRAAADCSTAATSRRACSSTRQDFFQNTFAVPARDAAAQPEQSVAREDGADQRGRHDGAVVAPVPARLRARTSCRPAPISAGSTATATSSPTRSRPG